MRLLSSLKLPLVLAALLCGAALAPAAHTQVRLVLPVTMARAGDTVLAALELKMDPGWHTYWRNSGASGMPTEVKWKLPPGITAGELRWPPPERHAEEGLTTFTLSGTAVLIAPLKLAADLPAGPLTIQAELSWLECELQCVPGSGSVEAKLTIGSEAKPSPDAGRVAAAVKRAAQDGANLGVAARWDGPASGDTRKFVLEWPAAGAAEPDFFPYADEAFEVALEPERLPAAGGKLALRLGVKKSSAWPEKLGGVVVQKLGGEPVAYEVSVPIEGGSTTGGAVPPAAPATTSGSLLWNLLLAFIGGLILNIMPCVLPVIALKILGFVNEAQSQPARVRKLGLIYAGGVLASFLVLALMVVAVKAAGQQAGWGMQFGNPQFLVVLTILVTLVALNLFGLFEVTLSSTAMGAAAGLASQHGAVGAFFNGVLATVLATPCTAPFLGAALGFAFGQPALIIVLVFLTVGLGLAFPYVLLCWQPAWLKFLPKPGAWMERFKIAMGFPMLATAVWLFHLLPAHYGRRVLWMGLFLVVLALAAWVFGEFFQRGTKRRGLGLGLALALLLGGFVYAVEGQLRWRDPEMESAAASGSLKESPDGIDWQAWSTDAVTKARATGKVVLVDFTADWCLTCQLNKKAAIEVASVRAKLKELGAVALLGDHTKLPPLITQELRKFGRAGVPLVLVYPKDGKFDPIVLPEALTPGLVLDALAKAAK